MSKFKENDKVLVVGLPKGHRGDYYWNPTQERLFLNRVCTVLIYDGSDRTCLVERSDGKYTGWLRSFCMIPFDDRVLDSEVFRDGI